MKRIPLALLICCLLTLRLSAEDAPSIWEGRYKGVYCQVDDQGNPSADAPFTLFIGGTGSGGNVYYSIDNNALQVSVRNLAGRKDYSPPQVSKTRFYLPAIFANPIAFEAKVVQGGFDEPLIEGTIVVYALSIDEAPKPKYRFNFKAGRLP